MTAPSPRTAAIREKIDHPVIDSDGHTLEFLPAIRDQLRQVGGDSLVAGYDAVIEAGRNALHMSWDERRAAALFQMTWWGYPARNTRDRAAAMLPKLQYERLEELGLDYVVLYPTFGLGALGMDHPELRHGMIRAYNRHFAECFGDFSDRISHVAMIPMHHPDEALEELDYAVGTLGFKTVLLAGHVFRPVAKGAPRAARWLDTFGHESPYNYEPVWAKCDELGVSPTFHSSAMGWYRGSSQTNYVHNHIGNFAAAGEVTCRSLFMNGVPKRFPRLQFAFLEGGVGWGCNLYSDIIGHFEKRNRDKIHDLDPKHLDRDGIRALVREYGGDYLARHADDLDESLDLLCPPDGNPNGIDEFERSGIESVEDVRDVFTGQFHFGCEANDPINATAFDTRMNPMGARLSAIFSSDIGHWDVPDTREVLGESYELVEKGLVDAEGYRAFVFDNPVALWTKTNPAFFEGTAIESDVASLKKAGRAA